MLNCTFLVDNEADKAESKPTSSCAEGDHQSHREASSPATIKSYKMCNASRMEVVVISYGATIVSIKCPDKYGDQADVVLGFDDLQSEECIACRKGWQMRFWL